MSHLALGVGGPSGSLGLMCYALAGVALAAQLARDAYARAALVCELYPSFPFAETLAEELLAHATRLPGTRQRAPTLALLVLYALALVAARLQLPARAWALLLRLARELPVWLPFLASEPEVPELLSEEEEEEADDDAMATPLAVNATECRRALERLVEEKLRFADHRVERPDGWLVFDPLAAELVPQKKKEPQPRRAEHPGHSEHSDHTSNSSNSSCSAVDLQHQLPAPPPESTKTLEPHVFVDSDYYSN